jgi:hypothetical protein
MKTLSKLGILAAFGSVMFLSSCAGDYYVSDEPTDDVVYEQPAAPFEGAVWIGDDWVWSGGRYVHHHGHWEHAREGHHWVAGTWEHNDRGYRWHRGRWE